MTLHSHAVEPALFDRIVEYSAAIAAGEVTPDEPLSDTTPIAVFCQNFFAQFLASSIGYTLTRMDGKAKTAVVRIRIQKELDEGPVASLIAMFEDACDLWPDVTGGEYAMEREDFANFHETFLPQLLDEIIAWTSSLGDRELEDAAKSSKAEYDKALDVLRPKL